MKEDKRKDNGGARAGAGRKSVRDEERAQKLALQALIDVFGSELDAFKHLCATAKSDKSYRHLERVLDYVYGKPTEKIITNVSGGINIQDWINGQTKTDTK